MLSTAHSIYLRNMNVNAFIYICTSWNDICAKLDENTEEIISRRSDLLKKVLVKLGVLTGDNYGIVVSL